MRNIRLNQYITLLGLQVRLSYHERRLSKEKMQKRKKARRCHPEGVAPDPSQGCIFRQRLVGASQTA